MNSKNRTKTVDGIIIHSMGEIINDMYADKFLEDIGLSAHYLVTPEGDIIYCVDPERVAYHAGKSRYNGQENLNDTFVGIEFLVEGKHTFGTFRDAIENSEIFKQSQYGAGAKICRDLMATYPEIIQDRILRHSTVSGRNVRVDPKIDPGKGFKMDKLKNLI